LTRSSNEHARDDRFFSAGGAFRSRVFVQRRSRWLEGSMQFRRRIGPRGPRRWLYRRDVFDD